MTREQLDAAGGWAFPARHTPEYTPGMTLRDWFAGQVVAGCINMRPKQAAELAYEVADAMLEARATR